MKRILSVILLSSFLSLLWFFLTTIIIENNTTSIVSTKKGEEKSIVNMKNYTVVYEKNYNYSKYEPMDGCYLGSYVMANKYINFSSKQFDILTGKNHPLNLTYIKAGKHINENWMFRSMANSKMPYIVLKPMDKDNSLNELLIETTIRSISQYNTPYFLVLYPNPTEYGLTPEAYITFFRNMSDTIKDISPKCAIVWSVSDNDLQHSKEFYPGDNYIDWIGLNLRIDSFDEKYLNTIDNFYYMYEEKKPLIISELGVCNYSYTSHKYFVKEANSVIRDIYELVPSYPRIKGINYLNVSLNNNEIESIYSITEEKSLLDSYKKYIKTDYYLKEISKQSKLVGTEKFTYKEKIILYNNTHYIEECKLIDKLSVNLDDITKILYKEKMYYSLKDIDTLAHYSIIIDEDMNIIYFK